jgi:hypothetical protein
MTRRGGILWLRSFKTDVSRSDLETRQAQRVLWSLNKSVTSRTSADFIPLYSCFIRSSAVSVFGKLAEPAITSSGTELSHQPRGLSLRLVDDGLQRVTCHASWNEAYEAVRWRKVPGPAVSFSVAVPIAEWTADERRRFAGLGEQKITVHGETNKDLTEGAEDQQTSVRITGITIPVAILERKLFIEDRARTASGTAVCSFAEAVKNGPSAYVAH